MYLHYCRCSAWRWLRRPKSLDWGYWRIKGGCEEAILRIATFAPSLGEYDGEISYVKVSEELATYYIKTSERATSQAE